MAFCPNCGTPNTDQADKCVSCGFELAPKQKAKFKGTIMMSGIKVPGQQQPGEPGPAPEASAPPAPSPTANAPAQNEAPSPPAHGDRNPAFQKTMLGHAGVVPPQAPPAPAAAPAANKPDFAHAPTIQGAGPYAAQNAAKPATAPVHAEASGASTTPSATPSITETGFTAPTGSAPGASTTGAGFGGRSATGSGIDSAFPGASPSKPNPGKALAIGCGALLVLFCVVTGVVWAAFGAKIKALLSGGDSGAEAAAWQASISQSLAQVSALCQSDCKQASVFFHADAQASLLEQGKELTEARIQKLSDPESSKAEMLDGTEDEEIAKELGLDPQQCARVIAGAAKVVSCSVPEPGGKPSVLRIVHLSGVSSL